MNSSFCFSIEDSAVVLCYVLISQQFFFYLKPLKTHFKSELSLYKIDYSWLNKHQLKLQKTTWGQCRFCQQNYDEKRSLMTFFPRQKHD